MHILPIRAAWIGCVVAMLLLFGAVAQADGGEPFGLATVPAQGSLAATWRTLQARMKAERPVIARCRAAALACGSIPALQFIAIVDEGNGFTGLARIGRINRAVNFAIRAVDAGLPDGAHDDWSSPLQTLAAGKGDCKQYAVLKYAALQAAGFAADDLRIVIVERRAGLAVHAMVAVHNDGRWLILDNRVLTIVDSRKLLDRNRPLFTLDRRGLRQFVPRSQRTAQKVGAACAG
jgi:predicted transglutaminase-like cysteine proteinase